MSARRGLSLHAEADARELPAPDTGLVLVRERLRRMAAERPDAPLYTHLLFDERAPVCLTWGDSWTRACAVAAMLTEHGLWQRPVLLLFEAGPEFGIALMGTLLAGAIAVPVPVPQFASQFERLGGIAEDCAPGAVLSTPELQAKLLDRFTAGSPMLACTWFSAPTGLQPSGFDPPHVAPSDIAVLQYTSGSTSEPKGVALTHANIAVTVDIVAEAYQPERGARFVSWLPHFHDMGLVAGLLAPLSCDGHAILMSPRAFLQRPLRWLEAVSEYRAQISGAPNFGFDLCTRAAARGERPRLDLSCWRSAFAGAEPVSMPVLNAFADCFSADGFPRTAPMPCYGMAEATVLVTFKPAHTPATTYLLERDAAQRGCAALSTDPAEGLLLTGCGYPASGTTVRIVDPDTRVSLPAWRIGELWVIGPQVGRGYWNRQGDANPFGAQLGDGEPGSWLRTGDLGFLTDDGEFVFVDRLKDVIVVNGQNYVCHDLEDTAIASHPLLSAGNCIAVGVADGATTHLAVIAEIPKASAAAAEEVASAIRASLFSTCSLALRTVVLVPSRKLSRTTSGKLQRRLTARRIADGTLRPLAQFGEPLPSHSPLTFGDSAAQ